MSKVILSSLIALAMLTCNSATAATAFDVPEINGHPGYMIAYEISPDSIIDKVILVVTGFDTSNTSHPIDLLENEYQLVVDSLTPLGWDIIVFDYMRGDIDIKKNAENLSHFIGQLDLVSVPDYHLAVVGGSMGGIVTRTMFVQENSNLGVDTFVSLDSPHHGVTLSTWVSELGPIFVNAEAGYQMLKGRAEYNALYGWIQGVENSPGWMAANIDPMSTLAIALSNGSPYWVMDPIESLIHSKYHPVSCFVSSDPFESDFMPFHSVLKFNNTTNSEVTYLLDKYRWYNDYSTSYFDSVQPNPRAEHGAPFYTVYQALIFIITNAP